MSDPERAYGHLLQVQVCWGNDLTSLQALNVDGKARSRELSLAITKLQESIFWLGKAIAQTDVDAFEQVTP